MIKGERSENLGKKIFESKVLDSQLTGEAISQRICEQDASTTPSTIQLWGMYSTNFTKQ